MAMAVVAPVLNVGLGTYGRDMQDLAQHVTLMVGGQRTRNPHSPLIYDITVSDGGAQITVVLRVQDLYILGIRNANGTYHFNDAGFNVIGGNQLPIGCSYTASPAIEVYRLAGGPMETEPRNRNSIVNALFQLQAYAGGEVDDGLKVAFALLTHLISEALRFSYVLSKMLMTLQYGKSFTFAELRPYATAWAGISANPAHPLRGGLWTTR